MIIVHEPAKHLYHIVLYVNIKGATII